MRTQKNAVDIYQERFEELNEINKLGSSKLVGEATKDFKRGQGESYLDFQETEVVFGTQTEEEKTRIVEYFTRLGEHLANSQDGIYVKMQVDYMGVSSIKLDFPRVG